MQKELDRYLSPVLRKKYKTDLHLKKYPPNMFVGIRAFADQHSCSELLSISSTYTAQHFEEVSQSEEYLLLPIEQLVNILSSGMVRYVKDFES